MSGILHTDTSDFFSIDCGDIIQVGDKQYRVTGHERERRFGIEDPKFWVKRAEDVETGEKKILKLSYFESFFADLGGVKIRCFRNPEKEAQILNVTSHHSDFMHGKSFHDFKGNNIRVLDIVHGSNLYVFLQSLSIPHEQYFYKYLPDIMKKLVKAFEAIRFLHLNGYKHGDIRNDHIIIESGTEDYVWIDFDYDYESPENPYSLDLFGIGNILMCAIGKGIHDKYSIANDPKTYGDLIDRLEPGDFSILDKWRFFNLQKLYPYIPKMLNDILMHYSRSANVYYEHIDEIIEDMNRCIYTVLNHRE